MKKVIFVIDDKLSDMKGTLFSLQATLRRMLQSDSADLSDTNIVFCHICWDAGGDAVRNNQSFFEQERADALKHIRDSGLPEVGKVCYVPIQLEKGKYGPNTLSEMAERVIDAQRTELEKFCGDGSGDDFPDAADENRFSYVVLLDVVLDLETDRERILRGEKVLSNVLYERFPDVRRILYTNYEELGITEKWMAASGTNEKPIQRGYITRARGIYVPFKEKIYRAFGAE